jgi:hypothetical protein
MPREPRRLDVGRNTATWVDESYSKRLQRQAVQYVTFEDATVLETLAAIRCSDLYLSEQPFRYGYGINKKRGIRVFHVDRSVEQDCLLVATLEYNARGQLIRKSLGTPSPVVISNHALQRLYERLRTNSFAEVRTAIEKLVMIPPPDGIEPGQRVTEMSAEVRGLGVFHLVSEWTATSHGQSGFAWVVKSFVVSARTKKIAGDPIEVLAGA